MRGANDQPLDALDDTVLLVLSSLPPQVAPNVLDNLFRDNPDVADVNVGVVLANVVSLSLSLSMLTSMPTA